MLGKSPIWYFLIEQYLRKVPICTPPCIHSHDHPYIVFQYLRKVPICTPPCIHSHDHPYIVFQTMMSFLVYDWDGRHASEDDFLGSAYMVLSEVSRRHVVGTFCYNRTNCNRLGKSHIIKCTCSLTSYTLSNWSYNNYRGTKGSHIIYFISSIMHKT